MKAEKPDPNCGHNCNCYETCFRQQKLKKQILLLQKRVRQLQDVQLRHIGEIGSLYEDIREIKNDIYQLTRRD